MAGAKAEATAKAALKAADALEDGRRLFAGHCDFVTGVAKAPQLPAPSLTEVAFAGRSNVGKSSLINALTGRKALARTSNTPGRTREINFFDLGGRLMLVDLPGYGYARAAKGEIKRWNQLINDYLKGRPNLRRVCLLLDGRHGLKDIDGRVLALLDAAAVNYQVVLTKMDKVKPEARRHLLAGLGQALARHPAAHPEILPTSRANGEGMAALRAEISTLAQAL